MNDYSSGYHHALMDVQTLVRLMVQGSEPPLPGTAELLAVISLLDALIKEARGKDQRAERRDPSD